MKTYKSESNLIPVEWDIQQSNVYHNFNVVEVTREAEEPYTVYEYDVEEYTLQEYSTMQKQSISDLEDAVLELGELIGE